MVLKRNNESLNGKVKLFSEINVWSLIAPRVCMWHIKKAAFLIPRGLFTGVNSLTQSLESIRGDRAESVWQSNPQRDSHEDLINLLRDDGCSVHCTVKSLLETVLGHNFTELIFVSCYRSSGWFNSNNVSKTFSIYIPVLDKNH